MLLTREVAFATQTHSLRSSSHVHACVGHSDSHPLHTSLIPSHRLRSYKCRGTPTQPSRQLRQELHRPRTASENFDLQGNKTSQCESLVSGPLVIQTCRPGQLVATRGFFGFGRPSVTVPDIVQAGDPVLHEPTREVPVEVRLADTARAHQWET